MTATPETMSDSLAKTDEKDAPRFVRVVRPDPLKARPVILSSPHSGRDYLPRLCAETSVPVEKLRRSEDAYVDLLIEGGPASGASLVCALFPRVFIDVNRAADELDSGMYRERLAAHAAPPSRRVINGLGVIPRVGSDGRALYTRRLNFADAQERLSTFYEPYHQSLAALIDEIRGRFGFAIVLDMHSMPAHSAPGVDFVLGDRFGSACDNRITAAIETGLRELGFVTVRNTPYAGGHTTEHYGQPESGVHVIQIEINRGLYLHESPVAIKAGFGDFRAELQKFINRFTQQDWDCLTPS
jgi:N-formylglutamate amidohydrolase